MKDDRLPLHGWQGGERPGDPRRALPSFLPTAAVIALRLPSLLQLVLQWEEPLPESTPGAASVP